MQTQTTDRASTTRSGRDTNRGLRAWLVAIDGILSAIEEVVWQARAVGERTWLRTRGVPTRVKRLAATGWCLTKIASSYRLHLTRSAFVTRARAELQRQALHEKNARRFYELSREHGGAFLKVGQLLSTRADLLPTAWVRELSQLQDQAPTISFEAVRKTIEEDAGCELDAIFGSFEETPIAAASIGQVHRAVTLDGQIVAVKVRRPGIEALVASDLDVLEAFVEGVRSSLPPADWATIVPEIRTMVELELDYERELRTMDRLRVHFERLDGVRAPTPVEALSSARVIVSSFEPGRRVTDVLDELRAGEENQRVGTILGRMLEAYVSQVLEAGMFQADPHPGNFLVTEDDELVVLDFGCAKELTPAVRERYVALVQASLLSDSARAAELLDGLGFETESGRPETLELFAESMLSEFREGAASGELRFPDGDAVLTQARQMLRASERDPVVRIPDHFVMLGRVFGTLGGLFAHYRPVIDYGHHVLPAFSRALTAR